ncbi:hypothetical protein LRS74_29175 [Streptomyces sp. LX-29]|uniref:hypothetical protein n=1 Tax=Streptomyces sp. LX-29 TaxID=2900152 RepID=UPI00240E865E|nr:hypothetical protein [Streptomyces sp. LX-29]WFB10654.1 hypothetical protein LRS74_29175 [Streptomyces sp. LX-29]
MERTEASSSVPGLGIGGHWRTAVESWTARDRLRTVVAADSISVEFGLPETGREITVRFMTTRELLVAFMTDGRRLRPNQLAVAAAAANAWNTEQLIPMLSVWDVRGPTPCIAGVCALPLTCRMTQRDFDALARDWTGRARQMFTRCHQVFRL